MWFVLVIVLLVVVLLPVVTARHLGNGPGGEKEDGHRDRLHRGRAAQCWCPGAGGAAGFGFGGALFASATRRMISS
jgi:hypothetical protein